MPAEPGFPRLRRYHRRRRGGQGRRGGGAALGPALAGVAGAAGGRRAGARRRRPGRHADPRGRGGRQPRRRYRRRRQPAAGGRPVRRPPAVDGRDAAAAGPAVLAAHRHPHGRRPDHRDQAQGRREHPGAAGRQAPGPQRGRLLQHQPRPAGGLRAVRRQPRAGRLHPDRPPEQRHRRRRHPGLRPAPGRQHPLAAPGRGPRGARPHQGPAAALPVVHRPLRRRQVHHRQPGGQAPARDGLPHLRAGRRQRPPRPEQGPGLHRRGPRREHPPRCRGGQADGRRRPDRAGQLHLALPRRAADGARAVRRGRVPRGLRRHAAGGGRAARRQGPVRQGARRRDQELHRHRLALRGAGSAGNPPARRRGRARAPGRRGAGPGASVAGMSGGAPAGRAYLPEVDGLRALAVVAVVLYHLDPAWVPGGYVGVDVFFVISGFLITRIITDEHTRGEFGFASFYLRRIRRIAPAALAMVLATLFAGSLLLLPEDLERLVVSALWTVFQAANVFFWLHLDTGYFAASSKEEPLLHAWSLGVEEQFYLLWPVLLALLLSSRLRGRALLALLGLAAAASFWLAQASLETAPKFAYYMLPARAGELLTGAVLALALRRTGMRVLPARLADVIGAAGLAAVLWAMAALSPTSAFPGLRALPPVLGSAALILAACAGSPLVRMVFAWRPMVWIGLLSYSLYLWHWPVLAYARYFFVERPGGRVLAVAVVVFVLLAWASYRWIETPARHWDASGACQVGWLLIVPAVTVALLAIGVRMPGGVAERIADSEVFLRSRAELE